MVRSACEAKARQTDKIEQADALLCRTTDVTGYTRECDITNVHLPFRDPVTFQDLQQRLFSPPAALVGLRSPRDEFDFSCTIL